MTADINAEFGHVNRTVAENVTTLLFRMGIKQKALAMDSGIAYATFNRKMNGIGDWTLREAVAIAAVTSVEVPELLGDLPDFDTWRARRDSNPKPSDP